MLRAMSELLPLHAALQGFVLSLGLIAAIGAQNAFVLRQGLKGEHVGPLVLACALSDAVLMAAGITGLGQVIGERPVLGQLMAGAGVVFLLGYGLRSLYQARRPGALATRGGAPMSLRTALLQLSAFTLLNPHVYLDTVLLLGSVGAQQPAGLLRGAFLLGAASASLCWFTALGYGARWLAPVFARPRAWQVLDVLIGLMMLALALSLWPLVLGQA
jgi:L-lysine exporter family protein LysE/ArgO